jgi:hypothetical protein
MNRRLAQCGMAVLMGGALAALVMGLKMPAPVGADSSIHCVNLSGVGCDAICGDCHAMVQAAVDAADNGHEIRIAGGVYAPGGTVAVITKGVTLRGSYSQDLSGYDPDVNETVLDAQWAGEVISITNADAVYLQHLTLTRGNGSGNCGSIGCGGGVYASDTEFRMSECLVANNVGTMLGGAAGGGVYVHAPGQIVQIWNSRVVSNTASVSATSPSQTGEGGGIYVELCRVGLWDNEILDNVGSVAYVGSGGLHLLFVDSATVTTNTIRGNKSGLGFYWSGGGGLEVVRSWDVLVSANWIEDNWAGALAGYGGGVRVVDSDAHLSGNTIVSNTTGSATGYGGGVCVTSRQPVTLSNNLIVHNHSSGEGGGVAVVRETAPHSEAFLVNNTIADNGGNGVVAAGYATSTLMNNIVAGHGAGLIEDDPAVVIIAADTNLFWNTSDPIIGTNAIQEDPLLWGDYRLREGSPALDEGLNIGWLTTDLDGKPRSWDEYDLGAYEGGWWRAFLPLAVRDYV